MIELTRDDRERIKRMRRETDLRQKIKLEMEFKNLPNDKKRDIKRAFLFVNGFDPGTDIIYQGLKLRLVYFKSIDRLHLDRSIMLFYERGLHLEYRSGDNGNMGDDADRGKNPPQNIFSRESDTRLPSEIF